MCTAVVEVQALLFIYDRLDSFEYTELLIDLLNVFVSYSPEKYTRIIDV